MRSLYVAFKDRSTVGAATASTAKRLGVPLTYSPENASVMAFTDTDALNLSRQNHPFYVSEQALFNLTDRIGMLSLGIPVLPSSLNPTDFEGPVFVKYRRTYKQAFHPLSYTSWESAAALMGAEGEAFTAYQNNPDARVGEFVVQPQLAYPTDDIDVIFTVNERSEVIFVAACTISFGAPGQASLIKSCALPAEIEQTIRKLCKEQNVRGGAHNADFTLYNGQYCLMDWNPRFPMGTVMKHAGDVGFIDAGLLHMCGESVVQPPMKHFEQRGYFDAPLRVSLVKDIRALGCYPRSNNFGIVQVGVVTDTAEQAAEIFATVEALR